MVEDLFLKGEREIFITEYNAELAKLCPSKLDYAGIGYTYFAKLCPSKLDYAGIGYT